MPSNRSDRVVLVTGASSGIGRAAALEFAKRGSTVVGVARRLDELNKVGEEAASLGGRFKPVRCDVSEKEQVFAAVGDTVEEFGRLDVLVNNAGVGLYGEFKDLSLDEVETQVKVNLMGVVYFIEAALPHMLKQKFGRIVNVSSVAGFITVPSMSLYCAVKSAVTVLSRGLDMELKKHNIRVAAVCPGSVDTPFFNNPSVNSRGGRPIGPVIKPEKVAKAIVSAAENGGGVKIVPAYYWSAVYLVNTLPFMYRFVEKGAPKPRAKINKH
ncbi:MAG: SDR family oxidoreductase [Candidatus Caldarchaeum sp.]|nr:SDR family oxidoreductase [Candidatus Caldarchaeum sp.]